jgi:hypothetical protein
MFNQLYATVPLNQLERMEREAYRLVYTYVLTNGRISYKNLIEEGFLPSPNTIDRDNFCPCRRGSELLTHAACLARQVEYDRVRTQEYKDEQKQVASSQRVLAQEERQRQKDADKELKKQAKETNKKNAKIALNSMSPAEQKAFKQMEATERSNKKSDVLGKRKLEEDTRIARVAGAKVFLESRGIAVVTNEIANSASDESDAEEEEEEEEDEEG